MFRSFLGPSSGCHVRIQKIYKQMNKIYIQNHLMLYVAYILSASCGHKINYNHKNA